MAMDIAMRPGLWTRAGMAGEIVGLDWSALRALIPPGADAERITGLLSLFEEGMLEGRNQIADLEKAQQAALEERDTFKPPE